MDVTDADAVSSTPPPPPTTFCSTSLAQSPRPTLAVAKTLEWSRGWLPVLLGAATFPPFGVFKPPGVGRVFAAIYAATGTAAALRLPSGNSCGRGTPEARGEETRRWGFEGGTPLMGTRGRNTLHFRWELDTIDGISKGESHRWDFEGGSPWNPIEGNSREETHRWGFEGGTPLMGTQGRNPMDETWREAHF